jgi:hypothetical protein
MMPMLRSFWSGVDLGILYSKGEGEGEGEDLLAIRAA